VTALDPATAPSRTDLQWLRHRTRRTAPVVNPALSDFMHGSTTHPHHHHPPQNAPVPAPSPVSTSLDLTTPAPPPMPAPTVPEPTLVQKRLPTPRRARSGEQTILTPDQRSVTLNRLQSAIGTLTIQAACSAEVGHLTLGCAYQLTSGASSMATLKAGARLGPQDAHRPVLVATHDRFDTVAVDLRQMSALQRLAIIAFSQSRRPLRWGGTLLVTTLGDAKVAVPIEPPGTGQVAVLLTAYNVAGEIVLRREMTPVEGSVRDACRAFGFTRISWLDDRTPVD